MITGHGIDIVDIDRFQKMDEKRLERLSLRILTTREFEDYTNLNIVQKQSYLAKIWAAKEAISKAFGTGIRGSVIWKNMVVIKGALGQPCVYFINSLSCNQVCHLSISHDRNYLVASAILETR